MWSKVSVICTGRCLDFAHGILAHELCLRVAVLELGLVQAMIDVIVKLN
jgi:hypothetical protein